MELQSWIQRATAVPGSPGVRRADVTADSWLACARDVAAAGGWLLALWVDPAGPVSVNVALTGEFGVLVLCLEPQGGVATYPSLAEIFPPAARMQRAAADLCGIRSTDGDQRPWLRHAAWPADYVPLAPGKALPPSVVPAVDQYEFVRVTGDGVHEIPVGPVHAGIIEPGHFRFSVVGEKVLRLEERLGYAHKGIEQRMSGLDAHQGRRLAARVSGDSAVAYSWAYCQALEGLACAAIPERAAWLRALALESERIENHLGDLGALGNDAGFAFGLAQFSRLKELWLRAKEAAFGQRYLMDFVIPGGVSAGPDPGALTALARCGLRIAEEAAEIRGIYAEHAGVRDRFTGTGIVTPALATRLGLCGLAGRASAQPHDCRIDIPVNPYSRLSVRKVTSRDGDVAARVAVRFEELQESVRLVREIVHALPQGAVRTPLPVSDTAGLGVGIVEGWRGPVLVALHLAADSRILRCHLHDPSWQNWPVLEHAIIGNIVPDFPLINKSFNLSYSGHDL